MSGEERKLYRDLIACVKAAAVTIVCAPQLKLQPDGTLNDKDPLPAAVNNFIDRIQEDQLGYEVSADALTTGIWVVPASDTLPAGSVGTTPSGTALQGLPANLIPLVSQLVGLAAKLPAGNPVTDVASLLSALSGLVTAAPAVPTPAPLAPAK